MVALNKKIESLKAQIKEVRDKNKNEEKTLRDDFRKADRLLAENINNYDAEMKDLTRSKEQASEAFEQVHNDLKHIQDEHKLRLEERKKRDEILAIMKKKNEE